MTTYIFNGKTYNDALLTGSNGKGYAVPTLTGTGITVPYYIAAMVDAIADAGKNMKTTSATSLSATIGSKSITLATAIPYSLNAFLQITSRGDADAFMFGQVTALSGTTLTFDAQVVGSVSGPYTDWDIMPAGARGATGTMDIAGLSSMTSADLASDDAMAVYDLSATSNKKITLANLHEQFALASQIFG